MMPKEGYILLRKSDRGYEEEVGQKKKKNFHRLISKDWGTSMIQEWPCIPLEFGLRARRQMEDKWCVEESVPVTI